MFENFVGCLRTLGVVEDRALRLRTVRVAEDCAGGGEGLRTVRGC